MFVSCKESFKPYRPMISLDGYFLKDLCEGQTYMYVPI